ncbi:MAG: shikimate dehydrogenase, partial [Bacillota bacterium]
VKPDNLQQAVAGVRGLDFRGVNVTIPHKEKVMQYLDHIDPLAQKIGAVNTIVNDKGYLSGYNTDLTGIIQMVKEDGNFKKKGKKAVILGAGGASRAVGIALCHKEIQELYLLNRTEAKAAELVKSWQKCYPEIKITAGPLIKEYYHSLFKKVDLIIDTTPVGMEPNIDMPPVVDKDSLHSNLLVVDLVYNPRVTTLMKAAQKKGAQTINGMGMLLYQGIESFRLWTGIESDKAYWWELVNII